MKSFTNNPAGRLHSILSAAMEVKELKHKPARETWARVLNVDANDTPALMSLLSLIIGLPRDARDQFERLEDIAQESWREPLDAVDELFSTHFDLNAPWGAFALQFRPGTLATLKLVAERLREVSHETVLSTEQLDTIRAKLNDTREAVLSSDLPNELRLDLVTALNALLKSLDEYQIIGNTAIRNTLYQAIVTTRIQNAGATGKHKSVLETVWATLQTIFTVVNIGSKVLELPDMLGEHELLPTDSSS